MTFGASADLEIYHDGSASYIRDTGTGQLRIDSSAFEVMNAADSEYIIKTAEDGAVELYYDGNAKLSTTSGGINVIGDATWGDGRKAKFGDDSDIEIYHSSGASYIDNSGGHLYIQNGGSNDDSNVYINAKDGETSIACLDDAGVELYYDTVKTFETNANGIEVFGPEGGDAIIRLSADERDDDHDKWRLWSSNSSSVFRLQNYNSGSWEKSIECTGDTSVDLYYDGTVKAYTNASGFALTEHLIMGDNDEVRLGNGADLKLYHDSGGHGYIDNATGNLNIRTVSGENSISSHPNAGVKLYNDNSLKIETTAAGGIAYNQWLFTHNCGHSDAIVTILNENSTVTERFFLLFKNSAGGHAGSVRHSGDTSVVYNTTSDYRLKENIQPIANAITQVKQLKPSTFNYKSEPDDTVQGFIAHEVKEVIPKGVAFGEKDGEDMMEMDYARLTPILTAALKEAIAKIETLETKVAALEAG